jgi:hypothetical protein
VYVQVSGRCKYSRHDAICAGTDFPLDPEPRLKLHQNSCHCTIVLHPSAAYQTAWLIRIQAARSTGAYRTTQRPTTRKLPNGTNRTATVVRDHYQLNRLKNTKGNEQRNKVGSSSGEAPSTSQEWTPHQPETPYGLHQAWTPHQPGKPYGHGLPLSMTDTNRSSPCLSYIL